LHDDKTFIIKTFMIMNLMIKHFVKRRWNFMYNSQCWKDYCAKPSVAEFPRKSLCEMSAIREVWLGMHNTNSAVVDVALLGVAFDQNVSSQQW